MIEIQAPALGLSLAVGPILRALPQWFGIEESTQMYIREAGQHPTLLAVDTKRENLAVGFLTLMQHSKTASEIYVMGVVPQAHRQGVGRLLLQAAETSVREQGGLFLQVKTLSDKHPDQGYQKTRAFYLAMGFTLLEEFPDLWGPANPCWQLIKCL